MRKNFIKKLVSISLFIAITCPITPCKAADLTPRPGTKTVRPTHVTGTFYPGDKTELYHTIKKLLDEAPGLGIKNVHAILVPHAGYVYSGAVTANGFREIPKDFNRVFIMASNHSNKANLHGISIPEVTHYAIPGTEIPLDKIADDIMKEPYAFHNPHAHTMHMLEIELPFLYYLNGYPDKPNFTIIPIIMGSMTSENLKKFTQLLNKYNDGKTLFVYSADLSHYHPDLEARQLDSYSIDALMSRDAEALKGATTDANALLTTLISLAQMNHWQPTFLEYRNSGYGSMNKNSVVGYASIVFADPLKLSKEEEKLLLEYTRNAVAEAAKEGDQLKMDAATIKAHPIYDITRSVFVTLKKNGALRGCIGQLLPRFPLHGAILHGAYNATLNDHRFKPVTPDELKDIKMSISILDYPQLVLVNKPEDYLTAMTPLKDGVIIKYKGNSSTYLPQVWEQIPDPEKFLSSLCRKQGAPSDCWKQPETRLFRYGAYVFEEEK